MSEITELSALPGAALRRVAIRGYRADHTNTYAREDVRFGVTIVVRHQRSIEWDVDKRRLHRIQERKEAA
jgi:hypothetical protein